MHHHNGKWHYRGHEYATLYEALSSVWPTRFTVSNP